MANRRYRPRGIQRTSFHKWADQNNVTIYRDKEGNVIRTVKTKDVKDNKRPLDVDTIVSLNL
jgi:hypothetical protein